MGRDNSKKEEKRGRGRPTPLASQSLALALLPSQASAGLALALWTLGLAGLAPGDSRVLSSLTSTWMLLLLGQASQDLGQLLQPCQMPGPSVAPI